MRRETVGEPIELQISDSLCMIEKLPVMSVKLQVIGGAVHLGTLRKPKYSWQGYSSSESGITHYSRANALDLPFENASESLLPA